MGIEAGKTMSVVSTREECLAHTRIYRGTYLWNGRRVIGLWDTIDLLDRHGLVTSVTLLLVVVNINLDIRGKGGDRSVRRVCCG